MTPITSGLVDVYVYRGEGDGREFLVLRRSPDRLYPGSWRMVAGKVGSGEQAWQAAVRELWEETALHPLGLFVLPSLNQFYEWQTDSVKLIPAFAARVDGDPELNGEHDAYAWLPAPEAARRLKWPEQRRLLLLAESMLVEGRVPASLRIPVS